MSEDLELRVSHEKKTASIEDGFTYQVDGYPVAARDLKAALVVFAVAHPDQQGTDVPVWIRGQKGISVCYTPIIQTKAMRDRDVAEFDRLRSYERAHKNLVNDLRVQLAGQAMQGALAGAYTDRHPSNPQLIASNAVAFADSLIHELEKGNE